MSGIYIHIPFCKTRCIYCDFFSTTSLQSDAYVAALLQEIALRRDYLGGESVDTIYFGGGTPSQLKAGSLFKIFETINKTFQVAEDAEITLEANPDDLTSEYIAQLCQLPINRLSIGIQTFDEKELLFLKRRHSALQALAAVKRCQDAGFSNISIDLMYGLPNQTLETWNKNIEQALSLDVSHISAYHLIYEEGTPLYRMLDEKKILPVGEETSVAMFSLLIQKLKQVGFEHYEISNFARDGLYSRHNTSYWTGKKYLGLGASAHSFDGKSRQWNVDSLDAYGEALRNGKLNAEVEEQTAQIRYNDFVMTGLRTMWGVDLHGLETKFGKEKFDYCLKNADRHLKTGLLILENHVLKLSSEGIFVSDGIMSDLMWV